MFFNGFASIVCIFSRPLLILILTDDSDEDEDRPTRRRRVAERAAEGAMDEDDEEVSFQLILSNQLRTDNHSLAIC